MSNPIEREQNTRTLTLDQLPPKQQVVIAQAIDIMGSDLIERNLKVGDVIELRPVGFEEDRSIILVNDNKIPIGGEMMKSVAITIES